MTPTNAAAADVLRVGDVTLDLARQVVRIGAADVRLRPKTFDVLTVLVRHAGQVVSKQRLIEAVWGDVAVTDDSLVQCLVEIRRALGDGHFAIRTVRGRGYLLDGEVTTVGPASDRGHAPVPDAGRPIAPTVAAPRAARRWAFGAVAAGALLSVMAAVAALGPRARQPDAPTLQDSMNGEARTELDAGLALLRTSRAQTDLQKAREHFARAVALDPAYAGAHAALGNVLVLQSGFGVQPALELLPLAAASARRAVALDPTLAAGWQALAHVQTQADWDWAAAEQSYRRAIALDPSAPFNVVYAHLLVGIGRLEEAITESDRLLAIDPASPVRLASNCIVKYLARRYAAALTACDRSVQVDATYSNAHFWRALVLTEVGRHEEAMQAALTARRAMAFAPTWVVGYLHARAGRLDEAREVLTAVQARAVTTYVPPVELAFLLAAVGERTQALAELERAHRLGGPWMELLAVHPAADPLRAEPRFRALLRALRLPELS